MCWCTPNIRTPCCGKPECHPRDKAAARSEYWKAEHNAANTEINALRARVSELEEIARLAAASVRNRAWAGICDEDILLEQALVKANFI